MPYTDLQLDLMVNVFTRNTVSCFHTFRMKCYFTCFCHVFNVFSTKLHFSCCQSQNQFLICCTILLACNFPYFKYFTIRYEELIAKRTEFSAHVFRGSNYSPKTCLWHILYCSLYWASSKL